MVSPYEQTLIDALKGPIIIEARNPRSHRMKYLNARNNTRNKVLEYVLVIEKGLSVCCDQKRQRIIIGPKDFDAYLPMEVDLGTIGQNELTMVFKRTYPLPLFDLEMLERRELEEREKMIERRMEEERIRNTNSSDILESLGFGKKKE